MLHTLTSRRFPFYRFVTQDGKYGTQSSFHWNTCLKYSHQLEGRTHPCSYGALTCLIFMATSRSAASRCLWRARLPAAQPGSNTWELAMVKCCFAVRSITGGKKKPENTLNHMKPPQKKDAFLISFMSASNSTHDRVKATQGRENQAPKHHQRMRDCQENSVQIHTKT